MINHRRQGHRLRRKENSVETIFRIGWVSDTHIMEQYFGNPELPGQSRPYYTVADKLRDFAKVMNENNVDSVIHTGDITDTVTGITWFRDNVFSNLNPSIIAHLCIGNHETHKMTKEELAIKCGYEGNEDIAGSKFNYTFDLTNGGHVLRIIVIDTTNYLSYDGREVGYAGICNLETRNWIASELTTTDNAFLFMHHPPHLYGMSYPQFFADDALALRDVVNNAISNNPNLKVNAFFGHAHGNTDVLTYNNLGNNFKGHLCTALIERENNAYFIINVGEDGSLSFQKIEANYPYI